jgi:hypothetical protein
LTKCVILYQVRNPVFPLVYRSGTTVAVPLPE